MDVSAPSCSVARTCNSNQNGKSNSLGIRLQAGSAQENREMDSTCLRDLSSEEALCACIFLPWLIKAAVSADSALNS